MDLTGLGDDDDKTVRVVLGSTKPRETIGPQKAPVDATLIEGKTPVVDDEWEEYQRYKAWKAEQQAKSGSADLNVLMSNSAIGLKKTIRIIVDESPDMPPTGYPVGLNGTAYIIRPGEAVDVPTGVLEVIQHAIQSVPIVDSKSQRIVGYRDRPRIPWRFA